MKDNNLKPGINFIAENISDSELKKLEKETAAESPGRKPGLLPQCHKILLLRFYL